MSEWAPPHPPGCGSSCCFRLRWVLWLWLCGCCFVYAVGVVVSEASTTTHPPPPRAPPGSAGGRLPVRACPFSVVLQSHTCDTPPLWVSLLRCCCSTTLILHCCKRTYAPPYHSLHANCKRNKQEQKRNGSFSTDRTVVTAAPSRVHLLVRLTSDTPPINKCHTGD